MAALRTGKQDHHWCTETTPRERGGLRDNHTAETQLLLFPDLADREPQELLDGSARLALQTMPRFDKYTTPQAEEHAISPGGEGHSGELCVFLEEAIGI